MSDGQTSLMATTPPKEGIDARVGREMGRDWGWLLRRTKRVEELMRQPRVMDMADQLACHIERFCAINEIPVKELEVDIEPTQTKRYITLRFSR